MTEDSTAPQSIPVVILAGGRSRRMGSPKAEMLLDGKSLLQHVINRMRPQTADLTLNSNAESAAESGIPTVADSLPDFQGPLSGILAAIQHTRTQSPVASHVLTVPVDCPFLPLDLVSRLQNAARDPDRIIMAQSRGRLQHVCALWPLSLEADLQAFLANSTERKVERFIERHAITMVDFTPADPKTVDPFFNINTPDDLARAETLLNPPKAAKVFGISGWKNSGKTGLAVRLVEELTARGYRISTIKHAHHDFDIDKVGADSFRHRQAGAHEVTIVSGTRFAIMHELRGAPEPSLDEILRRIAPCDLVLIEGYKREPIPKIEARRIEAANRTPLAPSDPHIIAIAADHPVTDTALPVFDLDDTRALADFVVATTGLRQN